ncbi:MAG: aminopeptidase [Lachnospiraceae bacterium]|nr:aminopeptidase [Lachnospiraceae bacterium]
MLELRYELIVSRIRTIRDEEVLTEPFCSCFAGMASFVLALNDVFSDASDDRIKDLSLDELKKLNDGLYRDIVGDAYEHSHANPAYMASLAQGDPDAEVLLKYLCFLAAELRGLIPYAFEAKLEILLIYMELFVEVYCLFTAAASEGRGNLPEAEEVRQCLYWFERDNCEIVLTDRIKSQVDPACDFATSIVMDSDLTDLRYLYRYGEYITDVEEKLAAYLNSLSDEEIEDMAGTYTEGYRIGFEKTGKDLSIKKSVNIRYPIGFERMVRAAVGQFKDMGLEPVIYRAGSLALVRGGVRRIGYYGAIPNKQFDYDHKEDSAVFMDKDYVNRRLDCMRAAYEDNRELASVFAGPAVIEEFGEEPFAPRECKAALTFSQKQRKLSVECADRAGRLVNEYIKGEERSYTIIAYPKPYIGSDFEDIFKETVKLNNLDYKKYEAMQQIMIDVLDKASYVRVAGMNGNETEMIVALNELKDPAHETNFENCVADVNIPVGEVFTSPRLNGTSGILHAPQIYLEGLKFTDLKLEFSGGVIVKYSCANFDDDELNRKYIEDNLLFHHKTLPLGEFAIGTNTTAYRMARDFGIEALLPILIGEKTGPHFAVGDTCYSYEEDLKSYNPDGKAIVARSNDFSDLRDKEPDKAYFHCHTDITIPYDELAGVYAVMMDGEQTAIIENGLFVLEGLEALNEPLMK